MIEHRAAVRERLVDQEADPSRLPRLAVGPAVEGLRKLNIGRDQILARLWELANLSHEVTRGIIAGQIKALSMIVAIEGLIQSGTMNDRRFSPSGNQPAAPPINAQIYTSEWRREQQHQAAGEEPGDAVAAAEAQPAAPQVPDLEPASNPAPNPAPKTATGAPPAPPERNYDWDFDRNQPSLADPLIPQALNRVPLATDSGFNALMDSTSSPRQPFSLKKGPFARRR
jgi:hypothetical protein